MPNGTDHSRRTFLGAAAGVTGAALVAGPLGRVAAAGATPTTPTTPTTAAAPSGGNRFLAGPFRPVDYETTEFQLTVTGKIPADLDGRLLRTGSNAIDIEDPVMHHWYAGEGMVHGVRLRDGKAEWYRSRWVRAGDVPAKLGEPARGKVDPETDFPSAINIIGFNRRTLALQEGRARPNELTDELYTVGPCDFDGTWSGTFSAHTKHDPRSGELHSVSYDETKDYVSYVVVNTAGKIVSTRNIPMGGTILMHDFALTENHVVLYDQPIVFDLDALKHGQKIPWVWDGKRPHRVGIMPRTGGDVRWFPVKPSFVSHTLNAYEEHGKIVCDYVSFPAPFSADDLSSDGPPTLNRWTIDPRRGRVTLTQLDDRPQEFPKIADADVSRKHRFGYSAAAADFLQAYVRHGTLPDKAFSNGLVKHDLKTGRNELHRFPRHASASEPAFVPREGGRGGDDGYLLSYVHNPDRNASDLVILSAQDFTGTPLARVHLPSRIPLGLHGNWISNS